MNQSLSDLLGVNSLPPIGSVNLLPDVPDPYGIQRAQGKTYLRAGTLARSAIFPKIPDFLKPVGHMAAKSSQPPNAPISDMATDGKNTVVAVAYDSTVFVSTDAGDNWISRGKLASASGYSWSVATDGNGIWLAMARDGTIIRSTDNFTSWAGTLTPAQAALPGGTSYACRLDYVNGEFWVSRLNLSLSITAANNNHLYRLSSTGTTLTAVSLPATGANSAGYTLCGVAGNGRSLFVLFNLAGIAPYANGNSTYTYVYQFDINLGAFLQPYVICAHPAMTMAWDEQQQLWLVYGNNVYYVNGNYYYSMDVRLYDADMKLVTSWNPSTMTSSAVEGYYPASPVGEVVSWGGWGAMLKPNRNYCLDAYGRSGAGSAANCYFAQRPLGGKIELSAFSSGTVYMGAGIKVNRDLVIIYSHGSRDVFRVVSYVGLPYPNKPSTDTSMFLRVA